MKQTRKKLAGQPLTKSKQLFPVVGVGASAGGLRAFKSLLKAIPPDSGMAYVLVQHLSPNQKSLLPALLEKVTSIPVVEITDDIKLKPNVIFVIPSNKMLIATDGVLKLTPRVIDDKHQRNPIDLFFSSLAEVHQAHAFGVVLSGLAMDGTLGLKAIKENGGFAIAQDDKSAEYKEMPSSAVQSGVIDFVLAPDKIPGKIIELAELSKLEAQDDLIVAPDDEDVFKQIMLQLRIKKGTDFTYYKQSTIRRRILRRMALSKFTDLALYLRDITDRSEALDTLYLDLLIPVSSFFRDISTFDYLCRNVIPELLKDKPAPDPIRVWVCGCSTGQEAYSMAICMHEHLGKDLNRVQIFASDVSEPAIAKARAGVFSRAEVEDINPRRLKEFFTKTNGNYHINQAIRNMCVFAMHNFLKDPPFGKQDLISCRNVMIYMEPYLQKKAFTTFHYSLNPKGFLVLGRSESISMVTDLFSPVSKSDKIFRRKDGRGRPMPMLSLRNEQDFQEMKPGNKPALHTKDFQKSADQIILSNYTPAGVVVNEMMDIVYIKGNPGNYLELSTGKPTFNLFKLANPALSFELRNLISKATATKGPVTKEKIGFGRRGSMSLVSLEVMRLPDTVDPHYLILFHDAVETKKQKVSRKGVAKGKQVREDNEEIGRLRQELLQLREDMRGITELQEVSNEELQSSNEELLSGSEELQSLNEELETSKEELQSSLEELSVVNQELSSINELLTKAKNYAEAIVSTVAHPILILDASFRVKSANKSFYSYFKTQESETEGKLIYELSNGNWNVPALRSLFEQVLPQEKIIYNFEITQDFPGVGKRTITINAKELSSHEPTERLILITFDDITEERKLSTNLEHAVAERTVELSTSNGLLSQRNIQLKKANTELEAFNYVASHDLQEPLRKIQTFASRILVDEADNLSETGNDFFRRIQTSAKRMQMLIDDLLSFSRVSNSERKFEKISLIQIIDEVKRDLKEVIDQKGATIEITQLCDIPVIPFLFRQLMYNLISNSLKFSRPDQVPHIIIEGKTIFSSAEEPDNLIPEKKYCRITVQDNGIGFEPEYNERVFKIFQRLRGKEYLGTGIGLAIAKKIAENHSGAITASSTLGDGATFTIYVPASADN